MNSSLSCIVVDLVKDLFLRRDRLSRLLLLLFQEMSQLGNAHNPTHAALLGSQNAVTCPLCHKLFLGGENLMEHMKHTHKEPNASGVASK